MVDSRPDPTPVPAFAETVDDPEPAAAAQDAVVVGRYRVHERIGVGGMGVVYRAYDPELHRDVAIKVVRATRKGKIGTKRTSRLLREARAMAQLSHPNVVRVYDVGPLDDGLFIAMEFIRGQDARSWLKRERPKWKRIVGVFRAAGRGLAAAHARGLIHRDFKPANVMVGDDGRVRVLDFGLARAREGEATELREDLPALAKDALSDRITADGTVIGTPVYMAPEQHAGLAADAACDQFAFCVALYEALYGALPYRGGVRAMAEAKARGDVLRPVTDDEIPDAMFAMIQRGLSPKPADRFSGMPELLRELRIIHTGGRRRWLPWLLIALTLAIAAAVYWSASLAPACDYEGPTQDELLPTRQREAMSPRVGDELDSYVQQWLTASLAVCNAGEQAQAVRRCLVAARAELGATVRVLAETDSVQVERGIAAVRSIAPASECPSKSGPAAANVRPLAEEPLRARVLGRVGRRAEALALLEQTVAGESPDARAESRLVFAELRSEGGDAASARDAFGEAYLAAIAADRPSIAAEAAVGLAVLEAKYGEEGQAPAAVDRARAHVEAVAPNRRLSAALERASAMAGVD